MTEREPEFQPNFDLHEPDQRGTIFDRRNFSPQMFETIVGLAAAGRDERDRRVSLDAAKNDSLEINT